MAERITAISFNGKVSKFVDMGNAAQIVDFIYPVGSIFSTVDPNIDPNTRFAGTTWQLLEAGYFLEATTTNSSVNTKVEAGLPNITGGCNATIYVTQPYNGVGAVETSHAAAPSFSGTSGTWGANASWNINASRSSSVYGKSTTVQPKALRCKVWIRTA